MIRKRELIAGTSWRRDPLGPHFADNFIWASRFLQISLALPEHPGSSASSARAIPVVTCDRRSESFCCRALTTASICDILGL